MCIGSDSIENKLKRREAWSDQTYYSVDFVRDSGRNLAQDLWLEGEPVGSHEVLCLHGS